MGEGRERWLGDKKHGCSSRKPGFDSQHLHGDKQPCVSPVPQKPMFSVDLWGSCMHRLHEETCKENAKKFFKCIDIQVRKMWMGCSESVAHRRFVNEKYYIFFSLVWLPWWMHINKKSLWNLSDTCYALDYFYWYAYQNAVLLICRCS